MTILNRTWAESEIEILKQVYSCEPKAPILKQLKERTWPAIERKACYLGLHRRLGIHKDFADFNICWTDALKGYIAGLIDGEGSIELLKANSGRTYTPVVKISTTSKELADWLIKFLPFGEKALLKRRKINQKPCHIIGTRSCKGVLTLLESILPYLIIKKTHATLLLNYTKNHEFRTGRYGYNHKFKVPPIPNWEHEMYQELRELNRRGINDGKGQ
jgi:hypothetical protein